MQKKPMLPDVNIWLALTFESHVHHRRAVSWFGGLETLEAAFCRVTMLEFLRLCQNAAAFPGEAVSAANAWSHYQMLRSDERVSFQEEPIGIEDLLASHFATQKYLSPKTVTDTYLAAFARLAGQKIHTFDQALQKHPLLK
jgi:uncharacterized protein